MRKGQSSEDMGYVDYFAMLTNVLLSLSNVLLCLSLSLDSLLMDTFKAARRDLMTLISWSLVTGTGCRAVYEGCNE